MSSGAEEAVVRHALARGMVNQAAVDAARRDAAARQVPLLDALRPHLRPEHLPELSQVVRMSRSGESTPPAAEGAREQAVRALREARAGDPAFAPHADLVFERLEKLGEGGMGVVWRVRDHRLGRTAALKVMKDDQASRADVQRFVREAELTARLDHPSITPVYEAGTDAAGRHYMLMRVIEGEPLSLTIQRAHRGGGALAASRLRTLLEVLVKIGEAVAYAHVQRMVHRDLKPQNVMVGRFGEVMVMDWGLVRQLDAPDDNLVAPPSAAAGAAGLTMTGALLGTPGYMSPEQAGGDAIDVRTDVFALGAILVEMLTSRAPVVGESAMNIVTRTVQGQIAAPRDRWPGCPRELDAIARAALAPDPEQRTATAEAFVADLRAYLVGDAVSVHPEGPVERALRAARRRPAALMGATAAALLLAIAGLLGAQVARARQATADAESRERFAAAQTDREREARETVAAAKAQLEGALAAMARAEDDATRGAADAAHAHVQEALRVVDTATMRWSAARVYARCGRFDDARAVLEPNLGGADAPAVLFFMSRIEREAHPERASEEQTEGMRRLLELAEREPDSKSEHVWLARALAAQEARRPADAERAFERALELNPAFPDALLGRAATLAERGRSDDALARIDDMLARGDLDPYTRYRGFVLRANCLIRSSRPVDALESVDRAVALRPEAPEAYLLRMQARSSCGDRVGAVEDFERVVRVEVFAARALAVRAQVELGRFDFKAAAAFAKQAFEKDPDLPFVCSAAVICNLAAGDIEAAARVADHARATAPEEASPLLLQAHVAIVRRDEALAADLCARALAIDPTFDRALVFRASQSVGANDLARAAEDLTAVIARTPAQADARMLRAEVRRRQGDPQGAIADLDALLAMTPGHAEARLMRASLRVALGDLDGAAEDSTLVVIDPENMDQARRRAAVRLSSGNLWGAFKDAERVLTRSRTDRMGLMVAGQAAALLNPAEAMKALDVVLTRWPGDAVSRYARVQARLLMADLTGVLADCEEAERVTASSPEGNTPADVAEARRLLGLTAERVRRALGR